MKCRFIYNPNSGKGKINDNLLLIAKRLNEVFSEVEFCGTKYKGHARELAQNSCGTIDYLIFSGGDGTFNEVIQGISNMNQKPILGYIPSGTVNDIAQSLNIPKKIDAALDLICSKTAQSYDVCKINNSYFMYAAAAGIFTKVSYSTKQIIKKLIGKAAYFINIGDDLIHFNELNLDIVLDDKKHIKGHYSLILFLNSKSVAGFKVNKTNSMKDGKLDFITVDNNPLVKGKISIKSIFHIIGIFLFGIKKMQNKEIKYYEARKVEIRTNQDIPWCLDGEEGMRGSVKIEVLPNHVKIISK